MLKDAMHRFFDRTALFIGICMLSAACHRQNARPTELPSAGARSGPSSAQEHRVFDRARAVEAIRPRLSAVRACYEQQLRVDPTLAGKVVIDFTIERSGLISRIRVLENTLGSPAVGACVTGVIARLRCAPGPVSGPETLSFPFVFAPQN